MKAIKPFPPRVYVTATAALQGGKRGESVSVTIYHATPDEVIKAVKEKASK